MGITRRAALGAVCALTALSAAGAAAAAPAGKVTTVKISDYVFGGKKNLKLKATVGDTLKFAWTGQQAHNVELKKAPAGVKKLRTSLAVDHAPVLVKLTRKGTYTFVCTPHEMMGMTATVTVT